MRLTSIYLCTNEGHLPKTKVEATLITRNWLGNACVITTNTFRRLSASRMISSCMRIILTGLGSAIYIRFAIWGGSYHTGEEYEAMTDFECRQVSFSNHVCDELDWICTFVLLMVMRAIVCEWAGS